MNLECKFCETSSLVPIKCLGDDRHLLLYCSECDAVWFDPNMDGEHYAPTLNNNECPYGDGKLIRKGEVILATEEDLRKIGWERYIFRSE